MRNLRVEELEPRHLLTCTSWSLPLPLAEPSAAGWSFQPPLVEPFAAGTFAIRVVEFVPLVDYDGHALPIGLGRPCEGGAEIGPSENIPLPGFGGRGPEAPAPRAPALQSLSIASADKGGSGATWVTADHPESGPNATGRPGNAGTDTGAIQLTPLEAANGSRRAYGASADAVPQIPSETPIPQPPSHLGEHPVDAPSRVVDAPSRVEDGRELPSPQVSDLLTVLPPIDLSALERGMQQFLDQVEGLGERLGDSSGPGLYPWIAAVAAAAIACEIGRRQLRRPAAVPVAEGNNLSGFPPNESFAG